MFTTPRFAAAAHTLSLVSRAPFATTASTLAKRNWMGNHTHIYGGGLGDTT